MRRELTFCKASLGIDIVKLGWYQESSGAMALQIPGNKGLLSKGYRALSVLSLLRQQEARDQKFKAVIITKVFSYTRE